MARYDITLEEQCIFAECYIEAMAWANTIHEDDDGMGIGDSIDSVHLPESVVDELHQDCLDFLSPDVVEILWSVLTPDSDVTYSLEQAGHDFALTRNGHGAGFWDRGLGDAGKELSEIARPYGSRTIMVSLDGTVSLE